jgi:hypothetical protein
MLLYWFCTIARIWSTSRLLPPCDGALGTSAFGQLDDASGVSGPVNVESEGWSQSTWNLYTVRAFRNSHVDTKYSGVPAGGVPACSRAFPGRIVKSSVGALKDRTCVVAAPAYMSDLLKA